MSSACGDVALLYMCIFECATFSSTAKASAEKTTTVRHTLKKKKKGADADNRTAHTHSPQHNSCCNSWACVKSMVTMIHSLSGRRK